MIPVHHVVIRTCDQADNSMIPIRLYIFKYFIQVVNLEEGSFTPLSRGFYIKAKGPVESKLLFQFTPKKSMI